MSRHAAIVAARASSPFSHLALDTKSAPIVCSVARAQLFRLSTRNTVRARGVSSQPFRLQHAAAKDTKDVGVGPSAAIAGQLGLRRASYGISSLPSLRSTSWRTAESGRWTQQRRLFSDKRGEHAARVAGNVPESTPKSNLSKPSSHHTTVGGASSRPLLERLPHLHRPTKEELLAAATGFWHRLTIRFKWFSIRSVRPFNSDEIGAFLSWIFLGHVLWIVIGTTTFVSLAIWAVNTVFAQETLAGWVGNYLTKSSGVKVVFESAIVPTWRDGVITFNNVFVSRRPRQQAKGERTVSKGSSTTAAAAAAAEALAERRKEYTDTEDDGNYTQFDLTITTVNVTLSFAKWFNGKGLLHNVEVRGLRGVVDRTFVQPIPVEQRRDPKSYRHEHHTGDFEIEDFKMDDVLLTVYQPRGFRPFTISVFNCELPRLRKQWLFYDFMCASNMSGSFDDSLFTIHPRQVHGLTGALLTAEGQQQQYQDGEEQWKKHSRLRIDGLNIDHLNRGVEGPFSWIHEGNVDIVADVMIPEDEDGLGFAKVVAGIYDRVEATVTNSSVIRTDDLEHQNIDQPPQSPTTSNPATTPKNRQEKPVILDIRVHLTSVRASVPLFTKDLSYVNNALIRPIVAYINSRRGTFIPIACRVVKSQSEFDGSWTVFDSGLLEDLSREVYAACARDVRDEGLRGRRIRKVGWWGVQLAAQALFLGLAGQLA